MRSIRLAFVLFLISGSVFADISGRVHVIDGDTLDVGGVRVRLHGIDAPEQDQLCGGRSSPIWGCGAWATGEVRTRYEGRKARCAQVDIDRYGRAVARCAVDGHDMGAALVEDGIAFAYRRYAMDYDLAEKRAAVAGRGLHGTGVQAPAAYRAAERKAQAALNARNAPEGCTIKGNVSRRGERIYHVPGQRDYGRTKIAPGKGERWFCSEPEARAAGWRKAKR